MRLDLAVLVLSVRREIRARLQASLSDLGAAVVTASTEDEALQAALRSDLAVAILDGVPSAAIARSVARRLRAPERTSPVEVVLIEDRSRSGAVEREYADLGIAHIVLDPVNIPALRARIRPFVVIAQQAWTIRQQADSIQRLRQRELARNVEHERELAESRKLRAKGLNETGMALDFEDRLHDMVARCATLGRMIASAA